MTRPKAGVWLGYSPKPAHGLHECRVSVDGEPGLQTVDLGEQS